MTEQRTPTVFVDAPGFFTRAKQAARWAISSVRDSTWMSPLQPIQPISPTTTGRQYDFRVGANINYIPRGTERFTFQQLRALMRGSELMRMISQSQIDQVVLEPWTFKAKAGKEVPEDDKRIQMLVDFFEMPDKIHDWAGWASIMIEELIVTDAVSIYLRDANDGTLYAAEPIDGATIFPLIDENGRQPLAPDPAYQQILKGVPKTDYTSDELIYAVYKTQVNTPYGWSAVEQVAMSCKQEFERLKSQLSYFTDGSVPDAVAMMPDGMTPDQIAAYEDKFNQLLAGNLQGRRQIPFFPAGTTIDTLKEPMLKDDFDEWLARKFCAVLRVSPTPFIKQLNRSTGETSADQEADAGVGPRKAWLARQVNRIVKMKFPDCADLQFAWVDEREQDPLEAATIDATLASKAIKAINEIRHERGLDPVEGGDEPMLETATGFVPLPGSKLDVQMKADAAAATAAAQAHEAAMAQAQPKDAENPDEDGNEGDDAQPAVGGKPAGVKKKYQHKPSYPATPPH